MAQYTVEDIEILRQKSGISYEEAVNLLDYHNGSLARALVDLEKNGKLRDTRAGQGMGGKGSKAGHVFNTLYRMRVKVTKGNVTIVNLSVLFLIFTALTAFWVMIIGGVAALMLGYRVSIERNSRDFSHDNLESMVKSASSNIKNTAFHVARDMGFMDKEGTEKAPGAEQPVGDSAPSGTTPVNVQFPDGGSVEVKEGKDGFHEADIQ
ncbi:MAG: hypothetical protein VB099_10545 [Candidatus Limiplasma sp.]|nr:hypothetical protein [Candidatus Limiplasma sp.]